MSGLALVACGMEDSELDPELDVETAYAGLLESNGLPSNGLPMNGLPMNGLPSNGLPMNGLPMNGLPMNGLPMNGLPMNGLFNNWFHWFQGCSSVDGCNPSDPVAGATGSGTATSRAQAATIMKYIVKCACASGTTVSYTDRTGASHSWPGQIGFATGWCPGSSGTPTAPTVAEQEWVSACLMAMVNRHAGTIGNLQISIDTENPEFSTRIAQTLAEDAMYEKPGDVMTPKKSGTAYYGNLFGDTSGMKGRYAAAMSSTELRRQYSLNLGRDCAVDGCGGAFTVTGFASVVNSADFPAGPPPNTKVCVTSVTGGKGESLFSLPKSCQDNLNRTWSRVLVAMPPIVAEAEDSASSGAARACSADASGRLDCFGSGMVVLSASTHSFTRSFPSYAGISGIAKIRYKSSATGTLNYTRTYRDRVVYTSAPVSVSFPSTGNQWRVLDIPFSGAYLLTFKYANASSANIEIDYTFGSLP